MSPLYRTVCTYGHRVKVKQDVGKGVEGAIYNMSDMLYLDDFHSKEAVKSYRAKKTDPAPSSKETGIGASEMAQPPLTQSHAYCTCRATRASGLYLCCVQIVPSILSLLYSSNRFHLQCHHLQRVELWSGLEHAHLTVRNHRQAIDCLRDTSSPGFCPAPTLCWM